MSTGQTLLPLRVPELGPSLGKLVTGTSPATGQLDLSTIRYRLVTRLFEHAGEARRLAAAGERAAALSSVSRANWLAAWDEAVGAVADQMWGWITDRLSREADAVRMPPSVRDRLLPIAADRKALTARIGSAGALLVPALDDLERKTAAVLEATALEQPAMDQWTDALRTAARRMEASWLEMEERLRAERDRWEPLAARISRWRKPLWPVWLTGAAAIAVALLIGLILGGYLPAPRWLTPLLIRLPG